MANTVQKRDYKNSCVSVYSRSQLFPQWHYENDLEGYISQINSTVCGVGLDQSILSAFLNEREACGGMVQNQAFMERWTKLCHFQL